MRTWTQPILIHANMNTANFNLNSWCEHGRSEFYFVRVWTRPVLLDANMDTFSFPRLGSIGSRDGVWWLAISSVNGLCHGQIYIYTYIDIAQSCFNFRTDIRFQRTAQSLDQRTWFVTALIFKPRIMQSPEDKFHTIVTVIIIIINITILMILWLLLLLLRSQITTSAYEWCKCSDDDQHL